MTAATCRAALNRLRHGQLADFAGLPTDCSEHIVVDSIGPPYPGVATGLLGSSHRSVRFTRHPDSEAGELRLWWHEGRAVLVDAGRPAVEGGVGAVLESLGEPQSRRSRHHGPRLLDDVEWIWPDRGLSLYVDPQTSRVLHVIAFAPTTLDDYVSSLAPSLEQRLLPELGP